MTCWSRFRLLYLCGLVAFLGLAEEQPVYFSREYTNSVDISSHLPMTPGMQWLYTCKYRTTVDEQATVGEVRWKLEQTVADNEVIPEGLLVRLKYRAFDIQDNLPVDIADAAREKLYRAILTEDNFWLVKGNYVHFLPPEVIDDFGELRQEVVRRYSDGDAVPDLFFPMGAAKVWAEESREREEMERARLFKENKGPAPNAAINFWHHIGIETVHAPVQTYDTAHHLTYFALSGSTNIWFVSGIGIVKSEYRHRGSLDESESILIAFQNVNEPR